MTRRLRLAVRHLRIPLLLCALAGGPRPFLNAQYPVDGTTSMSDLEKLEGLIKKAERDLREGDFDAASKSAKAILALDPDNALALAIRAESLNWQGRCQEAERDALKATKIDEESGRAWRNAAWAELRLGKPKEALEAAAKAASLEPGNADSRALRAYAAEVSGDARLALEEIGKAAGLDWKYSAKLSAARAGKPMFEPNAGGSALFLDRRAKPGRAPSPWKWLIAAAGAAAFLRWIRLGRRKAPPRYAWEAEQAQAPTAPAQAPLPAEPADAKPSILRIGEKYELGRSLGRGSVGEVFEAKDRSSGGPVAIKCLAEQFSRLDPDARARVILEAAAHAGVKHPGIAQLVEAFEFRGELLLVFEFADGKPLRLLLEEGGAFAAPKAAEILQPVCEALDAAHAMGKAHFDVKPSNIMVSNLRGKLTDFGVVPSLQAAAPGDAPRAGADPRASKPAKASKSSSAALSESSLVYAAPEMETGDACARSDVYSLGAVLYEMLTGSPPFSPPADRLRKLNMDFVPLCLRAPHLPARLDNLMQKALAPYPAKRLKTPGALLKALQTL